MKSHGARLGPGAPRFRVARKETLFLGLVLTYMMLFRTSARHPADTLDAPEKPCVTVKSLLDPVSVGIMRDSVVVRFVPARGVRDHVRYFEKPATGTALLEALSPASVRSEPYVPSPSMTAMAAAIASLAIMLAVCTSTGLAILDALPGWLPAFLLP